MTSPTPKSILNGVLVFLIPATRKTPIPAYFFATAIGAISLISKLIKSFPVDVPMISSNTGFNFSGVFGTFRRRKSTSTVTRLSKLVTE